MLKIIKINGVCHNKSLVTDQHVKFSQVGPTNPLSYTGVLIQVYILREFINSINSVHVCNACNWLLVQSL